MNKVILMGRLTRDPEVRYAQSNDGKSTAIGRYTLAVDRRNKQEGQQTADFISCVTFGKAAEFAEKYLKKGTKITISGRITTGFYTNKDGQKIYTTDVVVEEQEFAESKGYINERDMAMMQNAPDQDGFINIPEGIDEDLPFAQPEGR